MAYKNPGDRKRYWKIYYLLHKEHYNQLTKQWAKRNPEKRRKSRLKYYYSHLEKERKHSREYGRKYRQNNPDKMAEYKHKWQQNNQEHIRNYRSEYGKIYRKLPYVQIKTKARNILNRAVNSGRIKKETCEVRGCLEAVEAHHDDYNKPLNIRWLCIRHHNEFHRLQRSQSIMERN